MARAARAVRSTQPGRSPSGSPAAAPPRRQACTRTGQSCARRSPATPLLPVDTKGREDDQALDQLLVESIYLEGVEKLVEEAENERSPQHADHRAPAAEQANSADHHGGHR